MADIDFLQIRHWPSESESDASAPSVEHELAARCAPVGVPNSDELGREVGVAEANELLVDVECCEEADLCGPLKPATVCLLDDEQR